MNGHSHRAACLRRFWKQAVAVVSAVILLTTLSVTSAYAQTFAVLHSFTGGADGGNPQAGLTIGAAGTLYGTTYGGGDVNHGTVFRLMHSGTNWVLTRLYSFDEFEDGSHPEARVVIGPDGNLYGTTFFGGRGQNGEGWGTVFQLQPPPTACRGVLCPWTKRLLYAFAGPNLGRDGAGPYGDVIFDSAGNLYGTTVGGGYWENGNVYELTPTSGLWTETILYTFSNGLLGQPRAGLTLDGAGNLYGTTAGNGDGGVFELTPSGGGWIYSQVYAFGGFEGSDPFAGVIFDDAGNLYGATRSGGVGGGGTVFMLQPSNGGWSLSVLYSFAGSDGPWASLVFDQLGNLYGTTFADGSYGYGSVFKLTPSNGGWTYTSLHDFTGGADGANPISIVTFDNNGNLYGTTSQDGSYGYGVAWEITP